MLGFFSKWWVRAAIVLACVISFVWILLLWSKKRREKLEAEVQRELQEVYREADKILVEEEAEEEDSEPYEEPATKSASAKIEQGVVPLINLSEEGRKSLDKAANPDPVTPKAVKETKGNVRKFTPKTNNTKAPAKAAPAKPTKPDKSANLRKGTAGEDEHLAFYAAKEANTSEAFEQFLATEYSTSAMKTIAKRALATLKKAEAKK